MCIDLRVLYGLRGDIRRDDRRKTAGPFLFGCFKYHVLPDLFRRGAKALAWSRTGGLFTLDDLVVALEGHEGEMRTEGSGRASDCRERSLDGRCSRTAHRRNERRTAVPLHCVDTGGGEGFLHGGGTRNFPISALRERRPARIEVHDKALTFPVEEDGGALIVVGAGIRTTVALHAHTVHDGVLRDEGREARIAHRVVVDNRGNGEIAVRLQQVFPVNRRHERIQFAYVPAGRPQKRHKHAMRGPQPQIEFEDISDVSLHHHHVVGDINRPVSKRVHLALDPRSQALRAGKDDGILTVRPDLHKNLPLDSSKKPFTRKKRNLQTNGKLTSVDA